VNLERVNVISNSGQSHLLTWGVSDILGKNADLPFPLIIVSGFGGVIQEDSYAGEHLIQETGLNSSFCFPVFYFLLGWACSRNGP
jgi:hypothetical protein